MATCSGPVRNVLLPNPVLFNMINTQQCVWAEDEVRVKRKLLVFNDVFQSLSDSTQQLRAESCGIKRQQESVLLSFVSVDGTVSYLWAL